MYTHNVPKVIAPPGLLTVPQAAALLGMNVETVRDKIDNGKLATASVPGSRKILINRKTVERYARRWGIELREASDNVHM